MLDQPETVYIQFDQSVSKYRTLKTSSQTVSVQVQPVRYQSQPGDDPHGYNRANYQRQYHLARYP